MDGNRQRKHEAASLLRDNGYIEEAEDLLFPQLKEGEPVRAGTLEFVIKKLRVTSTKKSRAFTRLFLEAIER